MISKRPSDLLGEIIDRRMSARERVGQGRVIRPVGNKRELVFNEDCANTVLVSTTTPKTSSSPNTSVPVLGAQGGSGRVAVESSIVGRNQGAEFESHTLPVGLPAPNPLADSAIVLKVTGFGSGSIVFDIARFEGAAWAETLHTGVTTTGWPTGHSAGAAGRALSVATTLTGLTGVPDGSILIIATTILTTPWKSKLHIVNIDTGAVAVKEFVPTTVGGESQSDRIARGWVVLSGELYVYFSGPGNGNVFTDNSIVQLAKFPGSLMSQTILNGHEDSGSGNTFSGGVFFPSDLLYPNNTGLTTWHRMPYNGSSVTEDHVSGKPDPGDVGASRPKSAGLASSKYWTVGNTVGGVAEDLLVLTTLSLADAVANGWASIGLAADTVFKQNYNSGNNAGFNFDRDSSHIVGFPVWDDVASTAKVGLMRLPIIATAWSEATFIELETGVFRPDMALPDVRDL